MALANEGHSGEVGGVKCLLETAAVVNRRFTTTTTMDIKWQRLPVLSLAS